jgi:hypothetical protein
MGTISPTLPTIGEQRGDGEGDVRNALSVLIAEFNGNIESANMKNAPLVLLSTLTVQGTAIEVANASLAALKLNHTAAVSGKRRFHIGTVNGVTGFNAVNDAGNANLFTFALLDHATGVVDFPNGLSNAGAGLGSVFDDRKKSIIAATESRTNTTYGKLATPDQVTVVLPTDGLIKLLFQATWQESVAGAARAAIFIGANQLKVAVGSGAIGVGAEAALVASAATVNRDWPLASCPGGLMSGTGGGAAHPGDVTTGQVVGILENSPDAEVGGSTGLSMGNGFYGGACYVFAAAGTYVVSVQFKASSGSVTAKNRKLWVAAETY